MKKILAVVACVLLINLTGFAQKLNGQWRGVFDSKGDIVVTGGDNTEYVLELEIKGSEVTGFSYTYFQDRKYYVICSLAGTYYKSTKSLRVTETAKVKGSTPLGWSDCLQTHILTYQKQDGEEELTGSWKTAPGQLGGCGTGTTTLTRRTLSKNLASFNKPVKPTPFSGPKSTAKLPDLSDKNKKGAVTPRVVKTKPARQPAKATRPPLASKDVIIKPAPFVKTTPEKIAPDLKKLTPVIPPIADPNFERRSADVLKTIEIGSNNFKVDLYDNGSVDGDSVSLFYNGKLILSHKMLSEKPISLTLDATTDYAINELTMYANNLGSIPPNTALMVITDGEKRYEVRISSDLKKSGTIRFVHKPKAEQ
jgi:hypothetical protein